MKAENKNYRIILLLIGLGFYYIFFATYWGDRYWYLDKIDLRYSFVSVLIEDVIYNTFFGLPITLFTLVETFVLLSVHAGYFYCLWFYRENIVVFIKKFINKI
jgi:hypothetical protein